MTEMMKIPPLTREQVRRVDQIAITEFGMSGLVLMENAGRGAAEIIDRIAPDGRVVILCGKGNNGGDGYVIARHLDIAGRDVVIVAIGEINGLTGDAAVNASIAVKSGLLIREDFVDGGVIVDCLLGTGASGSPRGRSADAVRAANESTATRIAIDIPTGLDCDTGEAMEPTYRAAHTITFVAPKVGFAKANAAQFVGKVHEVGIGVPTRLLRDFVGRTKER